MASLEFKSLSKTFGAHTALKNIDFSVAKGEFLALLGPSGCGKTTLLRLIAGFESPTTGRIRIGDTIVADETGIIQPEKRGIGMVFQSYALWPHMTVADNVGFALRLRRLPKQEREKRVNDALQLVSLGAMAERKPHQLSGGQRQRVALARCLAMRPSVILLDEPLANLDAHLRETMQEEFTRLHRETGATFVYVTHDQTEAMALADRVAVMSDGRIEQLAAPRHLYSEPETEMVAKFVGSGMVCPVEVLEGGAGQVKASLNGSPILLRGSAVTGERRLACLRAPDLALSTGDEGLPCIVETHSYRGPVTTLAVTPQGDAQTSFRVDHAGPPPAVGSPVRLLVRDGWLLSKGGVK
ncbi:ABC transporter ATP-binding protein [Shinella granuli]|uniref:Carbohydrate ABC transporter ATP-binding protein (CUT1 family) n=1 Tax=Shinella granuli TaxID=323621 RepID=A0A4R2C1Z2_SHIGR|nr:ABC transporter ATP-binding protein [Shinella granuli]TCN33525.1 carbohydrate ABC transporter ATP-binding protein (CUT1 family) [Shinella granuli]